MVSVCETDTSVNICSFRRRPGQPSKQTAERVQAINRAIVQAALSRDDMPSDAALAAAHGVSERTVRDIRLCTLGLNRHELKQWQRRGMQACATHRATERELVCTSPFIGLWLLVSSILDSGLARAARMLPHRGLYRNEARHGL